MKWNRIVEIEVRVGEINYGGHLGNDKALLLFHDARLKLFHLLGFTEDNIGEGIGIIMTEAHVHFRREVFLYDLLYVDVEVKSHGDKYFDLHYDIYRISDSVKVIEGDTRQLGFDYNNRKVARLPEVFCKKLLC